MYIEEIQQGQKIVLAVKIGTEVVEFESAVKEPIPKKHAILADAVIENDKVISFNSPNVFVDLFIYPSDSVPILFRNVKVLLYKSKEGDVSYAIATNSPSSNFNRRQDFRVFLGADVAIQRGMNRTADDAILKDLCSNGFSFTMNGNGTKYEINQTIHTVFNDRIEETCQNFSFHLYGIIIRKDEMEDGKIVYGCKLNSRVPGLENYVMLKERIRLRKKNGN